MGISGKNSGSAEELNYMRKKSRCKTDGNICRAEALFEVLNKSDVSYTVWVWEVDDEERMEISDSFMDFSPYSGHVPAYGDP